MGENAKGKLISIVGVDSKEILCQARNLRSKFREAGFNVLLLDLTGIEAENDDVMCDFFKNCFEAFISPAIKEGDMIILAGGPAEPMVRYGYAAMREGELQKMQNFIMKQDFRGRDDLYFEIRRLHRLDRRISESKGGLSVDLVILLDTEPKDKKNMEFWQKIKMGYIYEAYFDTLEKNKGLGQGCWQTIMCVGEDSLDIADKVSNAVKQKLGL